MSALTIKIKKGKSIAFDRIMEMVDCFEIVECKTHFKVNIDNEQLAIYHNLVSDVLKELPLLQEKEMFNVPKYGSNEWYDWIIDLHLSGKKRHI